jgi:hypothetical protein
MKFYHFVPDLGATSENVPNPVLAKNVIPEWYKNSELTFVNPKDINKKKHNGLKTCVPFLDALITGFLLTTWTDIYVKILDDGKVDIDWGSDATNPPISERPKELGRSIPRPAGHLPNHLAWAPKWGFKSPKGWSSLITHPLNRNDLPFTTTSGIMDTDTYYASGNIPFYLKEGFEGLIPKGTPFAQIIPIKRASWMGVYDPSLVDSIHEQGTKARSVDRGWYRDRHWIKKNFLLNKKGE